MIAGDLALSRPAALTRWLLVRALLIGLFSSIALAFIIAIPAFPISAPLIVGQVSLRTILAPEPITFPSQIQTDEARAKAESEVKDVFYPPDAELAREQVRLATRVFEEFDKVRHDARATLQHKFERVSSIPGINAPALTISRTLALDELTFHRIVTETLYVLDVTMRDEIRQSDLAIEYSRIPSRVSLALSADQADLVTPWAKTFVVPNSVFDPQKTNELRAQARDRVGTVYRTIEKGEAVVREGELITPLVAEALEALGIMQSGHDHRGIVGPALFAFLLIVLLSIYLIRMRPSLLLHPRVLLLIAFIVLVAAMGAEVAVTDRMVLIYLYPISAGVMLLAVLVDSIVALGVSAILALMVGFIARGSLEVTTLTFVGCVIASLTLGRIDRLPAFLWAGTYVALGNACVVAIFRAAGNDIEPVIWGQQLTAAFGNGALAGLTAIGSLFVLGKLFGITTSLELIDLARPTHPLLQKLLSHAPGTFHHSLVVSQLAEQAAQRIGGDALLVRVAAYYHDVGKIQEPQAFIENQVDSQNIHDSLEPRTSAEIVIDHVLQGLGLARQYGLPRRLTDFILQHHGTTLAAYFHRKALKACGQGPIDEARFRYPGPKPQSREAGILMLADGIEAATRAERPATSEQIQIIIDRIVQDRLRDGQLDECELTLRDIHQTKEAFFNVLQGLYHSRVSYPEPVHWPETSPESIDSIPLN